MTPDDLRGLFAALHGTDPALVSVSEYDDCAFLSAIAADEHVKVTGQTPEEVASALETAVRELALARLERLAGALGYAFVETPAGPALAPAEPQAGVGGGRGGGRLGWADCEAGSNEERSHAMMMLDELMPERATTLRALADLTFDPGQGHGGPNALSFVAQGREALKRAAAARLEADALGPFGSEERAGALAAEADREAGAGAMLLEAAGVDAATVYEAAKACMTMAGDHVLRARMRGA